MARAPSDEMPGWMRPDRRAEMNGSPSTGKT